MSLSGFYITIGADIVGPVYALTAPVDGDFAWINQEGATITSSNGALFLQGPTAPGTDLRVRKKAAPATPYTITAAFIPSVIGTFTMFAGLCWRQSSDGKLVVFVVQQTGLYNVVKYNSPTAISAGYASAAQGIEGSVSGVVWLRIADDGVNRICSYSRDGANFLPYHTVGRTDFMTADEVGFVVNTEEAYSVGMTLLSWVQA